MECDPHLEVPAVEQLVQQRAFSLQSLYASVGIDLHFSKVTIPIHASKPNCGETTERDAHALLLDYFDRVPYDEHTIVALIARSKGDSDLGIMFERMKDSPMPRQAFAVFVDVNRALHPKSPSDASTELLLTTAHELTHCFNLHHCDFDRDSRGHQTIEGADFELDTVDWNFSNGTRLHFATDPLDEVLPGRGHWSFGEVTCSHKGRHRDSPPVELTIVDQIKCSSEGARTVSTGLRLELRTPKSQFALGEPIFVTVGLHNESSAARKVSPYLSPEYGLLALEVRKLPSENFRRVAPAIVKERRRISFQNMGAGESVHSVSQISYAANGWIFQEPGDYEIRAAMNVPTSDTTGSVEFDRVSSSVLRIRVEQPKSDEEKQAAQTLFGPEVGMFLALGGTDHLPSALDGLANLVEKMPTTRQAGIARLMLANALLNPTIDLKTNGHPSPHIERAKAVLSRVGGGGELPALLAFQTYNALADSYLRLGLPTKAYEMRREAVLKFGKDEAVGQSPLPNQPLNTESILHGPAVVARHWSGNGYPRRIPESASYCIVLPGDSFWTISQRIYGTPTHWRSLQILNGFVRDPNLLYPGDPVLLPPESN